MPLDPQFRAVLDRLAAADALPITRGGVAASRTHYRALSLSRRGPDYRPEPVAAVHDEALDGPGGPLPVRVYQPTEDRGRLVVYLHGGGWVLGDLDSHDPVCRRVANALGARTVAVHYRRAPETPHPGAEHDALAALRWAAARHPDRVLGVAGDSAGASVAAAAALAARDAGVPLAAQLLLYPATDPTLSSPSSTANAEGYFLTRADMAWFYAKYRPPHGYLATADVTGAPPAVVATAEFDPLRDDGAAYAERLAAAGVHAVHVPGPGLIHGYFAFLGAVDAADTTGAAVLAAFAALLV